MSTPFLPLTPAELAVHRPVWDALGELFLDTDTRPSLPLIARTLVESGLDEVALDEIWREEITPALHFNLTLVAGEWAYFDLDWLEDRIMRRRAIRHRLERWSFSKLFVRVWGNEMQPWFQVVMLLRARLLVLPAAERSRQAQVWHWLARAYFWPELPHPDLLSASRATLAASWTALEPALRPLLLCHESVAAAEQAVDELLTRSPG
ncbi:hypothetical protein GCM10022631_17240 [Deinococcus rubellus]|uniref:DUF7079 domain-containing protein n=1 Tax=Deinococcus rubellus TaxID=1889240 RepID=A0ABY5YHY5_9DEIO|nr:hypothetical protein [Deinococcus rubellus]UWX64541.1 hypothetical protein N0D28_02425 [Deinococcus rubellus]